VKLLELTVSHWWSIFGLSSRCFERCSNCCLFRRQRGPTTSTVAASHSTRLTGSYVCVPLGVISTAESARLVDNTAILSTKRLNRQRQIHKIHIVVSQIYDMRSRSRNRPPAPVLVESPRGHQSHQPHVNVRG